MGKWRKWDEDRGGEMWGNMVSRNRGWNKKRSSQELKQQRMTYPV